ncbi:MAG: hypothetical protein N3A55_08265 [Methylohalobius sp.]|nr:hypothetical protein [Methylohalobius sp.]
MKLEALIERAQTYPPLPTAVVDAGETYVLEGAREAAEAGLIRPVLIGEPEQIEAICGRIGYGLDGVPIVAASGEEEAAAKGGGIGLERGSLRFDERLDPHRCAHAPGASTPAHRQASQPRICSRAPQLP